MNVRDELRRAETALSQSPQEALERLLPILSARRLRDGEFARALGLAERAVLETGATRAVAAIRSYRGDFAGAKAALSGSDGGAEQDLARLASRAGNPGVAAQLFERVGWLGHAAIQLEDAGDLRGARVLWGRLADDARLRDNPYILGLVRFNLSRAAKQLGDKEAARKQRVASMHAVEAAADAFETRGQRERAFDCYQVLLTLGREGAFENLAEGYLGCIRILAGDHLKYYVCQYYEDFIDIARERGELHAAATLLREASDYCRRTRLPYAQHYRFEAAEMQEAAAQQLIDDGGMPEMAENAFGAAIEAYNDLGLISRVRAAYLRLAELPLDDKRRERYARLARRLEGFGDTDDAAERVPFPDYLRTELAYPDVWRLDVIEWEQAGDPAEAMGESLSDSNTPSYVRPLALTTQLLQLADPAGTSSPAVRVAIAEQLGRVGIYAGLSTLEHWVDDEDVNVRAAVQRSARQLFFKRTFGLVMRGLRDEEEVVRAEAIEALSSLHFEHALDPLQRVYRDTQDREIRLAALGSIGKVPNLSAAELLLEVLTHGDTEERGLARGYLARADSHGVSELLRRAYHEEEGELRDRIGAVLRERGG